MSTPAGYNRSEIGTTTRAFARLLVAGLFLVRLALFRLFRWLGLGAAFGSLGFLTLLFGGRLFVVDLRCIHPFEKGNRGGVAPALTKFDDASIATIAGGAAGRDVVEQFLDRILLPQDGKCGS